MGGGLEVKMIEKMIFTNGNNDKCSKEGQSYDQKKKIWIGFRFGNHWAHLQCFFGFVQEQKGIFLVSKNTLSLSLSMIISLVHIQSFFGYR